MIETILAKVIQFVDDLGYVGIFIMTFIESTFVPIPGEITLIPVGYLIAESKMNPWIAVPCSVVGTIGGAVFNYIIARNYGRNLLLRFGKWFFITPQKLNSIERFFAEHGAISTFSGRMLPGIKHFISFPAGLAKMKFSTFITYTALGGFLWNTLLISLGYYIGREQSLLKKYIHQINISIILGLVVLFTVYFFRYKKKGR